MPLPTTAARTKAEVRAAVLFLSGLIRVFCGVGRISESIKTAWPIDSVSHRSQSGCACWVRSDVRDYAFPVMVGQNCSPTTTTDVGGRGA